ncbi:MAG: hypothetical protein AAFQ80_09445 [Cyanobacteria bacterium J06621_8]
MSKDRWDKFEIIFKTIILGAIPLFIKFGADNIAQSLKTGELVRSLISDLNQPGAKRDVALIALDAAIQENKKCTMLWKWRCQNDTDEDQVLDIALALVKNSMIDVLKKDNSSIEIEFIPQEIEVAQQIITKRASAKFYEDSYANQLSIIARIVRAKAISDADPNKELSLSEIESKTNVSQVITAIQPSPPITDGSATNNSLTDVRIVYVQYGKNKELAEKIQSKLKNKNISAPGIEKVENIEQNNIRYSNVADREIAEKLQNHIQNEEKIQIEQLINLSSAGYRVPPGQFEVWLK